MTTKPTCTRCQVEHSDPNHQLCKNCREYWRTQDAERRAGQVCVDCRKAKREKGKTRCAACAEQRRKAATELRATRKASGLCVTCGEKAVADRTMCERHLAYYAAR